MYFIPIGLFIKAGAPASFWSAIGKTTADFPSLTWDGFLINNLLPVTIGNIIGGALMVGAVYWFVYLRPKPRGATVSGGTQHASSPEAVSTLPIQVGTLGDGRR